MLNSSTSKHPMASQSPKPNPPVCWLVKMRVVMTNNGMNPSKACSTKPVHPSHRHQWARSSGVGFLDDKLKMLMDHCHGEPESHQGLIFPIKDVTVRPLNPPIIGMN